MKFHHRHSFFPFAIAFLTLILLVFMFLTFRARSSVSIESEQISTPISPQVYQSTLQTLTKNFRDEFSVAKNDEARIILTEKSLTSLLAMRVPSAQKELHLAFAVELNQLKDALRADDQTTVRRAFEEIVRLTQSLE